MTYTIRINKRIGDAPDFVEEIATANTPELARTLCSMLVTSGYAAQVELEDSRNHVLWATYSCTQRTYPEFPHITFRTLRQFVVFTNRYGEDYLNS